ncbi:EamA family transporter [Telmatospirillum sp.]|uniref:EamA family transporter n=1 Tax=Telmatospirillum sp. TaxID=2079197 RepID=UPI00285147DE|nr:EamA family transporter [Telmatospirillum sp.]MDR3440114.1 EamA family transporter [Telmatospirillum sp.]
MIKNRIPLRLALGLTLAILLDTVVQIFWKSAVLSLDTDLSPMATVAMVFRQPAFLMVALLLACQLFNWMKVLEHADLSYAQPITSLSYVTVCLGSAIYLKETVDLLQLVGIGFILTGVWFVSRTDHVSSPPGEAGR